MSGKIPLGFTIVETLIVLAISGVMVTTAIAFISGQQGNTEFNQGINQLVSNLQLQLNKVQEGSYYNNNDYSCSQTSNGINIAASSIGSQGTNTGCQYIGDVIQFASNGDNKQYSIYSVVSNQYNNNYLTPISSLQSLIVCSIYQPNPTTNCGGPYGSSSNVPSDAVETTTLPYNLSIQSVTDTKYPSGPSPSMIAFYTIASSNSILNCAGTGELGSTDGGGLNVDSIPIYNSSDISAVTVINKQLCNPGDPGYSPDTSWNDPIDICVNSGSNNKSAIITIGDNNNPIAVSYQIQETPC
jgi:Tfp pilus assembly protein PilE